MSSKSSSCSSSSLSKKASSVKIAIQKGAKALAQPFKKAKTCLSTCSESFTTADKEIASDDDRTAATMGDDNTSTTPDNSSDIEIIDADPEKELSASIYYLHHNCLTHKPFAENLKMTWHSPIYNFFKSDGISIQYHDGRLCHFFPCAALKCKTTVGRVRCFQDSKDKSSTANLKHHAIRCFGEEAIQNVISGKAGVRLSASIFSLFARQGQAPVWYSHRTHTNPEVQ
jgi:hypothetical protein